MPAADPSYPLYPIASISCSACLLVLLVSNILRSRHSFNFAVNLLCFCLFWETLSYGINAILWSDNANLKAFTYCDIVSHLQIFTFTVKPACTLIITRQLYHIASRSAHSQTSHQHKKDLTFELLIGLGLPALVTGPFYYVVQTSRFVLAEAFGCVDSPDASGMTVILLYSWLILLPLFSVLYYCPRIVIFFYQRNKLRGETSVTSSEGSHRFRDHDMRVLILGCVDIFLSLPFGILNLVLRILGAMESEGSFRFYKGWTATHAHWEPFPIPYAELKEGGWLFLFNFYFSPWASVILGFSIFALFGFTKQSRTTYQYIFWALLGLFGKKQPPQSAPAHMSAIQFGGRDEDIESQPGEMDLEPVTTRSSKPPEIGIRFGFDSSQSSGFGLETESDVREHDGNSERDRDDYEPKGWAV
ncbi:hypothetical protein PENSPDRAFT_367743 [Peniophora sp. CONT]|nr:hypothetical protein PENSPDRAFT_367743 [Peniophora sp. CONT]